MLDRVRREVRPHNLGRGWALYRKRKIAERGIDLQILKGDSM
jgi:hypothetical protein